MLEAQKGNKASFETLLRKYFTRIFNFSYRYLGNRESAEDLAQETFIRVHQAIPTYRPTAKFQTWLYVICRNLCLNELRNNKNKPFSMENVLESDDGESKTQFKDSNPNPYQELASKETLHFIQMTIHGLPENQKTAVILQRFEGFSYEEIAETLGCSVQAVKSLLNRAKETLKEKLSQLPEYRKR